MAHFNPTSVICFLVLLLASMQLRGQNPFLVDDPGQLFRKQERKPSTPVKTRYIFDIGPTTGREYLKQQDLLDPKGRIKSSGIFSEDGNKSGSKSYVYDAAGKLQQEELRFIGRNEKEITIYNAAGRKEKVERRTKGDTLLGHTRYIYDEKGFPKEEALYRGDKLMSKKVYEDSYNEKGKLLQSHHYEIDSTGEKVAGRYPLTVYEYDDQGMILQQTVYNNREKRKMLSWIYYKYQLDNDYRIIKQSGYNEEQQEIYRRELAYTDSSIQSTEYTLCDCPARSLDSQGSIMHIYNKYGEAVKEHRLDAAGNLVQTTTWTYDDFGNLVDTIVVKSAEPGKLIRAKTLLEFYTDQAKMGK